MHRLPSFADELSVLTFVLKPYAVKRFADRDRNAAQGQGDESEAGPSEQTPLLIGQDVAEQATDDDAESDSTTDVSRLRRSARVKTIVDQAFLASFLLIECLGFTIRGVNVSGSVRQYIAGTAVALMGEAGTFAFEPLLLELSPADGNAGRLFGAKAVVTALGGTLFSSILFNSVLRATIGSYPPAIFLVAAFLYILSFISAALIRVRSVGPHTGVVRP